MQPCLLQMRNALGIGYSVNAPQPWQYPFTHGQVFGVSAFGVAVVVTVGSVVSAMCVSLGLEVGCRIYLRRLRRALGFL